MSEDLSEEHFLQHFLKIAEDNQRLTKASEEGPKMFRLYTENLGIDVTVKFWSQLILLLYIELSYSFLIGKKVQ